MGEPGYFIHPSPQEQRVLELLADGMTWREVGITIGISDRTVGHCVERLKCRFGALNTPMMLVIATRRGFLPEKECVCA